MFLVEIGVMISIVITAFKEPQVGKAIESVLKQDIQEDFELLVACPDKETKAIVDQYAKEEKRVRHFQDPGKGKSFALNQIFKILKGRVWIFTDGDVFLKDDAVNALVTQFENRNVGCVSGRVVSLNDRKDKFGFWSHLLADAGAHRVRKEAFKKGSFLETTGYLFAFRNSQVFNEIPLDVAEDAIIPYYFWKKGFKIGYAENAVVYVKNPDNFTDWLKQRKRTSGAHETLSKYAPDFPRVKSFRNEALKGLRWIWSYPQNPKEYLWTLELIVARLYMWLSLFYDQLLKRKYYNDGWERVESTKQ